MQKITQILGYSVLILAFIAVPYLIVHYAVRVACWIFLALFEYPVHSIVVILSIMIVASIIEKIVYGRRNA